ETGVIDATSESVLPDSARIEGRTVLLGVLPDGAFLFRVPVVGALVAAGGDADARIAELIEERRHRRGRGQVARPIVNGRAGLDRQRLRRRIEAELIVLLIQSFRRVLL